MNIFSLSQSDTSNYQNIFISSTLFNIVQINMLEGTDMYNHVNEFIRLWYKWPLVPKICVFPNIFKYLITTGKKSPQQLWRHSRFVNIFQYLAKSYPAKHQSCHCPLGNVQFGPFPNLGDPYPSTLRSRLSWRRVWNFVHGRHNDGALWHDDHDVVVEGKQGLWNDVNCGNLLTALSKQHLPITFFCTFASSALISFRLYHVKE